MNNLGMNMLSRLNTPINKLILIILCTMVLLGLLILTKGDPEQSKLVLGLFIVYVILAAIDIIITILNKTYLLRAMTSIDFLELLEHIREGSYNKNGVKIISFSAYNTKSVNNLKYVLITRKSSRYPKEDSSIIFSSREELKEYLVNNFGLELEI